MTNFTRFGVWFVATAFNPFGLLSLETSFPSNDARWSLWGVADLMECQDGRWIRVDTQIVAVELINGKFMVVTGCPCYYGVVRSDATHDECIELLPDDLRRRLTNAKVRRRTDVCVSYVLDDPISTQEIDDCEEVLHEQLYGIVRDSATHEDCLDLLPHDLRARVTQTTLSPDLASNR